MGRVRVGLGENLVQAVLGGRDDPLRQRQPDPPQPGRADGDQEGGDGLDAAREVRDPFLDEVSSGQCLEVHGWSLPVRLSGQVASGPAPTRPRLPQNALEVHGNNPGLPAKVPGAAALLAEVSVLIPGLPVKDVALAALAPEDRGDESGSLRKESEDLRKESGDRSSENGNLGSEGGVLVLMEEGGRRSQETSLPPVSL